MKKDIPLTIETITEEDEQECLVTSARQIKSILRTIADAGTNSALYYTPNHNFIMTSVLDVDEDGLWIEQGSTATVNYLITESKKLTLVSSHAQVKVQFTVDVAASVSYDGYPALFLPLPSKLYRLQRREFFRLSLPPNEQLNCIINVAKAERRSEASPPVDLAVSDLEIPAADISGGGIGLICRQGDVELQPGETYSGCQITLPGAGPIFVNFTVMNLVILSTTRSGKTIKRAGCEFTNLDSQTTAKLQRFITDMQRNKAANSLLV